MNGVLQPSTFQVISSQAAYGANDQGKIVAKQVHSNKIYHNTDNKQHTSRVRHINAIKKFIRNLKLNHSIAELPTLNTLFQEWPFHFSGVCHQQRPIIYQIQKTLNIVLCYIISK
jgi:hypothetical protein